MSVSPFRGFSLRLFLAGYLFAALFDVRGQAPRIQNIRIGSDGRVVLQHSPGTNFYYILLRGDQATAILTAKDMQFGAVTNHLKDFEVATNAGFYRVRQVPLSNPLDSDGDGIDDVCEIKYRPLLDPLNANDANLDPDGDGRLTFEECGQGRNPFVADLPEVTTISYPTNATTASFVIFSGIATTNTLIRVEGGAAYVTNNVSAGGNFGVTVPLNPNRLNRLFVSAVDEFGNVSSPVPVDILQDSVAPFLFIDFPTNGTVLTATNTLVAGRVGDALSGFLGLNVTVNGDPANVDVGIGPNGTFQRMGVNLLLGTNLVTVVASDRLGNSITKTVTVIREEPVGPRLLALSGDLQQTNITRRLLEPIAIRMTQPGGAPLANQLVSFQVTRSDGRLLPMNTNQLAAEITTRADYGPNGVMLLQLFTDANGEARAWWTMGMDAGHANNRVTVSSAGSQETVYFCASALALPAGQINIGSGNNQRGETLGHAPEPLKVWVSDGNNPVAGVPVTFRVIEGGGSIIPIVTEDGASPAGPGLRASRPTGSIALRQTRTRSSQHAGEITVITSVTGHAEVDFIFGAEAGNQLVEATFNGHTGLAATFTAKALARVPNQPTSFVGLVQDNAMQPIGRAFCELTVAGATQTTYSDAQGRFSFLNIASGAGHLNINGNSANTLGTNSIPTNSFPALQYTIAVVPNAENSLPTSVLLPRLNTNNAKWYYGTNDLVVTCEGISGLKMTIKANSMKHPTGELVSPGRPALVSLNQVHHDDIPMPMPDGASPPFAWTLQPGGATFDPPVDVEYPNMSGLAPGAAAFFLTFNHDTERFEIVASGHVTADGSKIVCDPGAGLTISGWGCNCPPYSVSGKCCKASPGGCKECRGNKLVNSPDGTAADDGDPCTVNDKCVGGKPKGEAPSGAQVCTQFGTGEVKFIHKEKTNTVGNSSVKLQPGGIQMDGGVCYNPDINAYMVSIDTIKVTLDVELSRDGYKEPNPVVGGNVTADNYCCMIQKLSRYQNDGVDEWYMLEATRAHEYHHRDHDFPDMLKPLLAEFNEEIANIIVSCDTPNAAQVANDQRLQARLKMMNKYHNAISDFMNHHNGNPSPNDGAYQAGQAVLNKMIDRIRAFAAQQGFAPCGATPCAAGSPAPAKSSLPRKASGVVLTNAVLNPAELTLRVGQVTNLAAVGFYSDGSVAPLDLSRITFASSDPAMVVVSTNGNIAAMAPGAALVTATYVPLQAGSHPFTLSTMVLVGSEDDRDADSMPDAWELAAGLDPANPADGAMDKDSDGLSNVAEYLRGTNPGNADTDADGALDGEEVAARENPLRPPALDDRWEVRVGSQTVPVNADGSFEIPNISAPDQFGAGGPGTPPDFVSDDFVRLTGQRPFYGETLYVFSEPFRIQRGVSISITNLVYTRTPPPAPESIRIVPDTTVLNAIGQTTRARVTARFADGSSGDITPETFWTSYRSSNPGIATVNADGVVTARGRGMVFITAVNDGATAVCQIDVVPGDLLTVVRGTIRDTNSAPVAGVTVSLSGLAVSPLITGADGTFMFTNVPTSFGALRLFARLIGSNTAFFATATLDPVTGGTTDAGNITIQQGVTWISATSGAWHGATNWSNGQVPGPNSDVFLNTSPNVTVTISQGSNVVNNLVLFSPLRLTGGSLRAVSAIQANSPIQLAGGRLLNSTVDSSGLGMVGTSGTLERVTLNSDIDVFSGTLTVVNGLTVNGIARLGHPTSGAAGAFRFSGSQVLAGSGTILFGNSGCNALSMALAGTTLTNRMLVRGREGQIGYSTCVGGPQNVVIVNEGIIAADVAGGTITIRAQPLRNAGQLMANPGTLRVIGLAGNLGNALVSPGAHLDLDGTYTNNLALPITGATLTLNGDWLNSGQLLLTNSTLNLDGTFSLSDLGNITRVGGSVRVTGLLQGAGETLALNANTGSWTVNGGTLRQVTISSSGGALLLGTSGTLDAVTLNTDFDVLNGAMTVANGLTVNGVTRLGHPSSGTVGSLTFSGSQAIGGTGSILFGNSGCNSLRLLTGGTTLTNRMLIHGFNGQIGYSTCVGGPQNVGFVNEGTLAADVSGGTITVRAQPMLNRGQMLASVGTLRVIGLAENVGNASVSPGAHLDLDGVYTNNLALPVSGGTLTLNGDWLNSGQLLLTNTIFNLDGTFGLGDLGNITRVGGSFRLTGLLQGAGGTLLLDANTGSWLINGGTLRQVTVNSSGGALLLGGSGTLDAVTLNTDFDVLNGAMTVANGLTVNGVTRLGHPSSGTVGSLTFSGSQAIGGTGSILFGNSGCNSLRLLTGGTTLTNRVLIHGINGQIGYSTCVGGPQNVGIVNEGTLAADVSGGTITVRAQPMRNRGQLLASVGTLRVIGLVENVGNASVAPGAHLDLDGTYTNNLALPVNGGTLTLNGDWLNSGQLLLTNTIFNLDGTFGLGDLGNITRVGGSFRLTGLLQGAGGTLLLDANTGSWLINGGTLRQVTVNSSGGALLLGGSGTLDAVTLNTDFDVLNGAMTVANGLTVNGVTRLGHPSSGTVGSLTFSGSQAIGGTGSILFGNSGCNSLRLLTGGTTLTNRMLIHGINGQIGYSTCVGGPQNVGFVNEGTLAADIAGGTITVRAQPMRNRGQMLASVGTLRIIGLVENVGNASVSPGAHLDLDGVYTNNLALPVSGGTLTLNGDWLNSGQLLLTNTIFNLDGTFGLGDLGNITRVGGSFRLTGLLQGAGGTLLLDANTGSWLINDGTLRQVTVNSSGGALLLGGSGTLDAVTLNTDFDVLNGAMTVANGLTVNGVTRLGHPSSGTVGSLTFSGSQAIGGTGSILFGNSGCNALRLLTGGTTLTNRVLIHGMNGQIGYSTCVGGPQNISVVNGGTISADVSGGTLFVRAQPFTNTGTTNALNGGILRINP